MENTVQLTPSDLIIERPFTDPDHVASDLAILRTAAENAWRIADQTTSTAGVRNPTTIYFPDAQTWQKRTMVLDAATMFTATSLAIVGFFGNKRAYVAPEIESSVFEAGTQLCAALHDQPSIVCYVTKLLADAHNYTNLVVMKSDQTIEEWRKNEVHQRVTAMISPKYYTNVRIYSGRLSIAHHPRHFSLSLHRVKYFDYTGSETWYGVRELEQPTADASPGMAQEYMQ